MQSLGNEYLDGATGATIDKALLALATLNFQRIVPFYTALFTQEPTLFQPDRYAEYDLPGLRFGIFQTQPDHWPEFSQSQQSPLSLCLQVTSLEAAIAHLSRLGFVPSSELLVTRHGREMYAYDPDGNRLILWSDL